MAGNQVLKLFTGQDIARLLIVDDSPSILSLMATALQGLPDVEIATCLDGRAVSAMCSATQYDVLIVDYVMPDTNGIDIIADLRQRPSYDAVPIVMVTSDRDRDVRVRALAAGATDFLVKPLDELEFQARVSNLLSLRRTQVRLSRYADDLNEAVRRATEQIGLREQEMIWRLARAVEMRDNATGNHISRVAEISRALARGLGLGDHHSQMIYLAAPLHDIGKIGVTDAILRKPGSLDEAERAEMRRHVDYGSRILEGCSSELLHIAAAIARSHHERWDGSGYPEGLAGEAIPLEARIVAVADVFDALCSARSYKRAWTFAESVREVVRGSERSFDPACVRTFVRLLPEIEEIMRRYSDSATAAALETVSDPAPPSIPVFEFRSQARR